jgi:hypothetical protein
MIRSIHLPESCAFSDYFKLNAYPEEILNHFGYQFEKKELELPTTTHQINLDTEFLKSHIKKTLPLISTDNETARREFLISPILLELAISTHSQIRVNYTVDVSPQLRGSVDYLLQSTDQFLVVEAKDENLERGFKQLAVELIAIHEETQRESRSPSNLTNELWGAVSIGRVWQFSVLNAQQKTVTQDLNMYRVPNDLDELLQALVGILVKA